MLCHFPIQAVAGWKGSPATFIVRVQLDIVKYFDKELQKRNPPKGLQTLYLNTNLVHLLLSLFLSSSHANVLPFCQGNAIADLVKAYVDALVAHMKSLAAK